MTKDGKLILEVKTEKHLKGDRYPRIDFGELPEMQLAPGNPIIINSDQLFDFLDRKWEENPHAEFHTFSYIRMSKND
jgi:hypothetical protein